MDRERFISPVLLERFPEVACDRLEYSHGLAAREMGIFDALSNRRWIAGIRGPRRAVPCFVDECAGTGEGGSANANRCVVLGKTSARRITGSSFGRQSKEECPARPVRQSG